MDTPMPDDGDLMLTLRLELHLRRDGPAAAWCGELSIPGHADHLRFPSLPALIAWIARLESQAPRRGIR